MAAPTATSPRPSSQTVVGSFNYAATPTINVDFAVPFDAVMLTTATTPVVIRTLDGTDVTITGAAVGVVIPIRGTSIRTGTTTIANVVCLWA